MKKQGWEWKWQNYLKRGEEFLNLWGAAPQSKVSEPEVPQLPNVRFPNLRVAAPWSNKAGQLTKTDISDKKS